MSTLVSPIYTFSLAKNMKHYTPNQVQIGKSNLLILFIRKNADSGG